MSGRKLPPSRLNLTQMPSHDKKRRSSDNALSSLDKNTRRRETVTSREVSTVSRQSTALFGGFGVDNQDAIDILSPSDDSEEDKGQKSPLSPCLLPVTKFIKSPHEAFAEKPPPGERTTASFEDKPPPSASTSASKNADEEPEEENTEDNVEKRYLDGGSKTLIKIYNKLRAKCRRLESKCERMEMWVEHYRHRMYGYKDDLYDIRVMATSNPNSPESP